ncbi:MAG: hypothetical protein K8R02_06390 [Anaerohalosphaeraceae bacterium]|nr:hypothetical protein [Anaerohalosphaeraceae bacterium]
MKNIKFVVICSLFLLAASVSLVRAEGSKSDIGIFVKEIHGITRAGHPVRITVPIAEGDVNDIEHLKLTLDSTEVEASYRSMVNWEDGSIQWVAIDFFADVNANETKRYDLEYGPAVSHQSYPAMSVTSVSGGYAVDTGIIKAIVGDFSQATGIGELYYDTDDDGNYNDETNFMKGSANCDSIALSSNGGTIYRNTDGGTPVVAIIENNNIFTEIAVTGMSSGSFDFRANYIFYKNRSYIEKVSYIDYGGSDMSLCMVRSADYKFSSYLADNATVSSYNTAIDSFTPASGYHYYWYMSDPNPEQVKFLTYNGNTSVGNSIWFTSTTTNDPYTTTGELDMPAYFVDASSSINQIGVAVSTFMHEWGMDADFHCEYQSDSVTLAVQPHGTELSRQPSIYNDQWIWYTGLAKTFSSWLYVHPGDCGTGVKDTAVSLYKKLRGVPDSNYTMETDAFGVGQPNSDFEFEQWAEPIRRWVGYNQLDIEEYSMHENTSYNDENFFDVHGLQSGESWHGLSAVTGLPGSGRNRMAQPFMHWVIEAYRSGDIKLLEDTLENAQAEADYAHYHRGVNKGAIRYHSAWLAMQNSDYACRGFGYYYAYLATANPYFLECWQNELDFQYDYVYNSPEGWGSRQHTRHGGYNLHNFATGYQYFGDQRYSDAGNRIFNTFINTTRAEGAVRESGLGKPWMNAIALEGMTESYMVDPTDEKYRHIQRLADHLITWQNADGSFEYRHDIWKQGAATTIAAKSFLKMYDITGHLRYYTAAMRAINWSLNTINRTGLSNIRISDVLMNRIDASSASVSPTANSEIFSACTRLSAMARKHSLPFVAKIDIAISGQEGNQYGLNSINEIGTDHIIFACSSPDSSGNITVGGLSPSTQFKIDNNSSVSYLSTDSNGVLSFTTATTSRHIIEITRDGMTPSPIELDTPNEFGGTNFSWSPTTADSNLFAFNSRRSGHYQICVMDANGSSFNQLTSDDLWHSNPSWSPDGNKIAYLKQGSYWDKNIYTCNPDGSGHTYLTDLNEYELYTPRWRYDSGKILFSYSDYYGNDVAVMNPDGTSIDMLTNDYDSYCPVWSPDGSKIVCSRNIGEKPVKNELHIMNADGSNDQVIYPYSRYISKYMVWSQDGNKILIMIINESGIYNIWSMNPNGSNLVQLTTEGGRHPAYSPDGTQITYCCNDTIWLMDADGSGKHQKSVAGEYGDYPQFSHNGQKIAFMKYRLDTNISEYTADYYEIRIITESPQQCGDAGTVYLLGDLNQDCDVNIKDMAMFASEWLLCTDPADGNCIPYQPQPQQKIYSETFDTDPGWEYVGPRTPDSIYWEDSVDGGVIAGTYYRDDIGVSRYYTSDLNDVIGRPLDNTLDWTLSFDLYEVDGYKIYPAWGLVDSSDAFLDGSMDENNPANYIKYYAFPRYEQSKFKYDLPIGSETDSGWSPSDTYAKSEWYTVEMSWSAAESELICRVIVDGVDAFTWQSTITEEFSFDSFAMWDYYNTSEFQDSDQLFDNLTIVADVNTTPSQCGDAGTIYITSDLSEDCYVDFEDYSKFAEDWLKCTDPNNSDCDEYWK